jgi:hypothetical protein
MTDQVEQNVKQLILVIVFLLLFGFGVKFLLTYFYPSTPKKVEEVSVPIPEQVQSEVSQEDLVENTEDPVENIDSGVFTSKTNLTVSQIKNAVYVFGGTQEIQFVEGSFVGKTTRADLVDYAFGDINQDGHGDAIVLIKTEINKTNSLQLYAVINTNNYSKTIEITPVLVDKKIVSYEDINITGGNILLTMKIVGVEADCCTETSVTKNYFFAGNTIVENKDKTPMRVYESKEFGFGFLYPEKWKLESRPIYQEGKSVSDTIAVTLHMPFVNTYDTWTKKTFATFVSPGVCPYRNEAIIVDKKDLKFRLYDPAVAVTSNTTENIKLREYMVYKDRYCYTFVLRLYGPGPLAPEFPKKDLIKTPEDVAVFLEEEIIPMEDLLNIFYFL